MVRTRKSVVQRTAVNATGLTTTASRKRRASSGGSQTNESDLPAALVTIPRKRRVRKTDSDQLNEELEDATNRSEEAEHEQEEASLLDHVEINADARPSHFSTDVTVPVSELRLVANAAAVPSTSVRSSLSPAIQFQPTTSRKIRHSLPARLATPESARLVDQIQFAPLRQALTARKQRRLKRNHLSEEMNDIEEHDKDDVRRDRELVRLHEEMETKNKLLKSLNCEVEDMRQRGISISADDNAKAQEIQTLTLELQRINEELAARNSGVYSQDTDEMEDDVPFIDPQDLSISIEDMTPKSSFVRARASPLPLTRNLSPIADPSREVEVHRFERAIYDLNQKTAEAQAILTNVCIELQCLGFGGPADSALVICAAIRQAFQQVRTEAEELIPDQSPNKYNGAEFLKLLIDNIRGLLRQIDEYVVMIQNMGEMEAVLRGQNKGLLDTLSEAQARTIVLEEQCKSMDDQVETKSMRIVELEQLRTIMAATIEEAESKLAEKDIRIMESQSENSEQARSIQRFQTALETFRVEAADMESFVKRLQQEHSAKMGATERDADLAIADLVERLAREQDNCKIAEVEIDEKTTQITQLQISIESAETKVDQLKQKLEKSRSQTDEEIGLREEVEAEVIQKNKFIDDLEEKVTQLETSLDEIREQMTQLMVLHDTERRQREGAEAEIDNRDEKIAELEANLRDEGVRGNELRMKLFEQQQDRDRVIADLESAATVREGQFQNSMEAEILRREESERMVLALESKVEILESKIVHLDHAMVELIKAKDELLQQREDVIASLKADLETTREEYTEIVETKDSEINSLHNNIETLSNTLNQRAILIEDLELDNNDISQARQVEKEEKDGQIADLEDDVKQARVRIADLEASKVSLELRVDSEAIHLLQVQNENADIIEKLKNELRQRETDVTVLRTDITTLHKNYTVEITDLRDGNTFANESVDKLKAQVTLLESKLRERIRAERVVLPDMLNSMRAALVQVEVFGDDLLASGDKDLVDLDAMEGIDTPLPTTNGFATPTTNGKVVKSVTKSARTLRSTKLVRDSGVGMASDEVEAEQPLLA